MSIFHLVIAVSASSAYFAPRVDSNDNARKEVTNPSTSTFDIVKAEKYLMKELLKDLKKNEEAYGKFKESCK